MTFASSVQADIAGIAAAASELSEAVTYTPDGGEAISCRGAVTPGESDTSSYDTGTASIARCTLLLSTADVAAAAVGDDVTIDASDWKVERINTLGGGALLLELWQPRRTRLHGPGGRPPAVT